MEPDFIVARDLCSAAGRPFARRDPIHDRRPGGRAQAPICAIDMGSNSFQTDRRHPSRTGDTSSGPSRRRRWASATMSPGMGGSATRSSPRSKSAVGVQDLLREGGRPASGRDRDGGLPGCSERGPGVKIAAGSASRWRSPPKARIRARLPRWIPRPGRICRHRQRQPEHRAGVREGRAPRYLVFNLGYRLAYEKFFATARIRGSHSRFAIG